MSGQHQARHDRCLDDQGAGGIGRAHAMTTPNTAEHTSIDQPGPPAAEGRARHHLDDLGGPDLGPDVPTVDARHGLSASQRLLLGMVLFGPVTYRQAADRTRLTPNQVSQLCAAALRQLAVAGRPADGALGA